MDDNKRKLYDALSEEYDLGSFEQFSSDIADETKRRKLYDATIEEYDFPDFDTFSSQLGFGKAQAATEQAAPAAQPAAEGEVSTNFDDTPPAQTPAQARADARTGRQAERARQKAEREAQRAAEQASHDNRGARSGMTSAERRAAFNERARQRDAERLAQMSQADRDLATETISAQEAEDSAREARRRAELKAEKERRAAEQAVREETADDVSKYGAGNERYSVEEAKQAGEQFAAVSPYLENFGGLVSDFNGKYGPLVDKIEKINAGQLTLTPEEEKAFRAEYEQYRKDAQSIEDIKTLFDSAMDTEPGREYKEISERMETIAKGEKTPDAMWEYAQELARLQRNPLYRASLGENAPSEDEIQSNLLQGQVAYLETQLRKLSDGGSLSAGALAGNAGTMEGRRKQERELKKAISEVKEALYANPYYQQHIKDKADENRAENERIGVERAEYVQQLRAGYAEQGIDPQYYWQMEKGDPELQRLDAAAHMHDDAIREYETPTKYDETNGWGNVGRGFAGWASNPRNFSFGLEEFTEDIAVVRPVLEKVQQIAGNVNEDDIITNGKMKELEEALTPGELAVLDAYFEKVGAVAMKGADTSIGYQIGQGIGDMITLGLEMVATGGAGGAVSKGLDDAGMAVMKKMLSNRLYGKVARSSVGRVALWGGHKVVRDVLETAVRIPFMPSTYKAIGEGAVTLDSDYKVRPLAESTPEKMWEQYVEQLTEVSNGFAFPLIGRVVKTPGMQKLINATIGENGVRNLRAFMERGEIKLLDDAMIGSFGGEWEEELLGAVIHSVTDDPAALRDFFSAEQQLVLLGTLAPIPLSRGLKGGVRLAVPAANAAITWDRARKELVAAGLDEGRIQRLKDVIDNAPVPESARAVMEAYRDANEAFMEVDDADAVVRGSLTAADVRRGRLYGRLADYFWAAQQKRAAGLMNGIRQDAEIEAKRKELTDRYGTFSFTEVDNDGATRREIVRQTYMLGADGNPRSIFLLSDQTNSEGKLPYVDEETGSHGFVSFGELVGQGEDGTWSNDDWALYDRPVDAYLAGLVMDDSRTREAEQVVENVAATTQSLREQVENLDAVTYQGMTGYITNPQDDGATFVDEGPDGENYFVTWEELAAENGITAPEVKTETEDEVDEGAAVVDRRQAQMDIEDQFNAAVELSGGIQDAYIETEDGRAAVTGIIGNTIDPDAGTAQFTVLFPDGRRDVTMPVPIEPVLAQFRGETAPEENPEPEPAPAPEPAPTEEPPVEEPPVEEPQEEKPVIPVDKNGEKIYDAPGVSVEDALEDIYTTENVTEEMADAYIRDMAAEAEKGRNPKRGKMNLAEWGKATAEANRKADFWKEMKEFADANTAEREKERKAEAERQKLIEQYGVDPSAFDMTPQTVEEAVAEYLGGEKLISLDDAIRETLGRSRNGRVPVELFRHLGAHGILTKKGGQTIQDAAADIVREFYGDTEHDGEVDDVRNTIIDMLLGKTKTEIGETIFNNRLEEARRAADAFESVPENKPEPVVEEPAPEPEPAPAPQPEPEPATAPEIPAEEVPEDLPEETPAAEPEAPVEEPAAEEPKPETPSAPSGYGESNKIVSKARYEELRKKMLDKLKGNLNAGFDPEIFSWGVQMAAYHIEAGARKFVDFARRMIEDLTDAIRPYLKGIYNGARDLPGMEEYKKEMDSAADVDAIDVNTFDKESAPAEEPQAPAEEPKPETREESKENPSESAEKSVTLEGEEEAREKFTDTVANRLIASIASGERPYKSITDLRKAAREAGMEVDERGATDILLQELTEVAIVRAARKFMSDFNGGLTSRNAFNVICRLYEMQPTISMRSSQRVAMQQYSTPLPMSFVAQMFAYKAGMQDVLEPTAGNGMLVFGIPADKVHANELDETRKSNLEKQGFKEVTQNDATEPFSGEYDAVVANPPFGSHDAVQFDGKSISGLDPIITLRALDSMKDDGRAAIIIGGNVEWADNGSWKTKKAFFSYLYDHYNVKGVVNMGGQLYNKQGTNYPTMMILIDGRRSEAEREASTVYPPVRDKARGIATTNDELFDLVTEILNDNRKTDGNEVVRTEKRTDNPADRNGQTGDLFADDSGGESTADGTDAAGGERGRLPDGGGVVPSREGDSVEGKDGANPPVRVGHEGERPGSGVDVRPESVPGQDGGTDSGGAGVQEPGGRNGVDGRGNPSGREGDAGRVPAEPVPGGAGGAGVLGLDQSRAQRVARKIKDKILSYIHHSRARSLESVAPAAMVEDMDAFIQKIERELGRTIDDFVTEELGYNSTEELHKALAAEQIDSVAMAIYQMKQGKAMIIGDQTGVGKGRQMAALIRWANRQGKKPIFMTQKAGLFSDIYRDLRDIGNEDLKPLILNSVTTKTDEETGEKHFADTAGVMLDEDGNLIYQSPGKAELNKIVASGKVPDEYDFVVLTYSQLNTGDAQSLSESKKKAKDSKQTQSGMAKAAYIRKIADDNYVLLDESHTAAGEGSNSGAFLRSVMPSVKGVTFSSATFAKRPDTMPLYAIKSAMSEANVEPNELIAMIKKGGVTLQEIMSRALTRSGQMVRRERDMSDVKTDWKTVDDPATAKKARANYDRAIEIFNKIIQFQRNFITPVIDDISRDLAEMASSAGETSGTKNFGVDNPPFVSQTYNFTKQLMLALKADAIVDEVVKEIKAGRHPVIALENTYESGLDAYAVGDKIEDTSFSAGLLRSLGRILQYTVTDPDGNKSQEFLTPEELGPEAAKQYYALQDEIREATKGIFLSPLDLIKERLTGMGYNVGEVTGRKTHVVKEDDGYYRRERVADAKQAVRDFNSGASDVIIINKSGSTGISLHSSVAFKDQRPRSMIIAQPLGDINDYMQMIGRIDRTGQVHRGYYINLSLPVPAELRFNMMLASKLKSLNANTTTSQESDTGSVEAPDFLNKYGSQVVIEYLRDNPDVFSKLVETGMKLGNKQNAVTTISELENYRAMDEDVQKVTGRIALLPVEEQEKFYADISERYNTLIKYLDETGENTLKITTLPLKAKTLARRVGTEGKDPNGNNPFAQNSYVERVEVDVLRKPMKADEIRKVRETLTGGKEFDEYRDALVARVNEQEQKRLAAEEERYAREKEKTQKEIDKQIAALEAKVKDMDEVTRKAEVNRITNRLMANLEEKHQTNVSGIKSMHRKLREKFEQFNFSDTYLIYEELEGGNLLEGENAYSPALFCGFKTAKAGESVTPSTSVAVFATLDGRRRLEITFTSDTILDEISNFTNQNYFAARDTNIDNWDSSISNATREERYILTGNILQAWDDATKEGVLPGRLVSYTDIDGNIHDGILMNQSWQPTQLRSSGAPINSRTEQILGGENVRSTDGDVEIEHDWGEYYSIYVPKSKKAGAKYFENDEILSLVGRQGFHQYRGRFTASVTRDNLRRLLDILGNMGVRVNTEENESAWEEVGQETADQQSQDEEGTYFRQLTDPDKIAELEAEEKVPVYRSALFVPDPNGNVEFDLLDGKGKQRGFLYPPMSVKVDGKFRAPLVPGTYDEAEERPDLATDDGYFWLVDDNGDKMKVAYAPYLHNRVTPLNEQFAAAYKRNLVVIRSLVPKSELSSAYSAEKSRKATGMHDWPSGTVSNALAKEGKDTRKVILSRWAKIGEPVPYDQVADEIVDLIGDRDLAFEYNVVSPGLRKELMKRGVRFEGWKGNRPKNADSLIASMQPQFNRSGENLSTPIDRARAITTIDGIAKKLGVEFEQDSSLKAKGAFNPKTGKIRINIDAHKDTADLEATLLHEAVAHYGLRKLFGKDWRELRSRLYEQASPEIKAKVDALAKADGLSTEVAMEEYIAQLAEDGRFDAQEESFWQRIVTAIKRLLAKIGVNAGYLTDEDFRAMLYASYRNLQTGGALETAARVGVYQALRRNADASHEDNGPEDDGPSGNFRRWFGDSKVVDENGRPLVVYHGSRSTRDFSVFDYDAETDKSTGSGEKPAFFFSDEDTAGVYKANVKLGTLYEGEGRMVPAYLSIQNPAEIDYEGANFRGVGLLAERYNYLTKQWEPFTNNGLRYFPNEGEIISALRKRFPNRTFDIDVDYRFTKVDAKPPIGEFVDGINRDEYDGAIIRNIDEVGKITTDYVVFNSNQIKSAFGNNGEYSTEDPDIYNRDLSDEVNDSERKEIEDLPDGPTSEEGILYRANRGYAEAFTADDMYDRRTSSARSALYASQVDEYAPLDDFQESIMNERRGKNAKGKYDKLSEGERISNRFRELGGRAMHEVRRYSEQFLKPMWKAVDSFRKAAAEPGQKRIKMKELVQYVGLKSGLERNIRFAKRDARNDYQKEYEAKIAEINAKEKEKKAALDKDLKEGNISDVTYAGKLVSLQAEMEAKRNAAKAKLDGHLADVELGTDDRYLEYRKKDYAAVMAWFAEESDLKQEDYPSRKAFNRAKREARKNYIAGITDLESAESYAEVLVASIERDAGPEAVKELWDRINAATKETLEFQFKHGTISRQQKADIAASMEYYIPMRGFEDETAEDLYSYYMKPNASGFAPTVLAAKGRGTRYKNPFGMIGFMHSSAVSQGLKNEAKLSILNLIRKNPDNTLATITRAWFVKQYDENGDPVLDDDGNPVFKVEYPQVPEGATADERQNILDDFEQRMKDLRSHGDAYNAHREVQMNGGVVAFEKDAHKNEHIIKVLDAGREYGVIVNGNPSAAQAVNGVRRTGGYETFLSGLRWTRRLLSQMFTTLSVPFWISNFQRDHGQGAANSFIRNNLGYVGKYIITRWSLLPKMLPLVMGRAEEGGKMDSLSPKTAEYYRLYVENGGPMGQNRIENDSAFNRQMERYLRIQAYDKAYIARGCGQLLNLLGSLGEAVETITRFSTFVTSMESGRSLHEAISDSKEVSTNFARKGHGARLTWEETGRLETRGGRKLTDTERGAMWAITAAAEFLRAGIPFFNASIQGIKNKVDSYKKNWAKSLLVDSVYLAAGFALRFWAKNAGGDDDKEKYGHTSDYLRRNNTLTPLGDGRYLKWALPQEYRFMFALGDIAAEEMLNEKPTDDLVTDAFEAVAQLLPWGVADPAARGEEFWLGAAKGVLPGVVTPVIEAFDNRDFKGSRIYNEGFNGNKQDDPGWTKAIETTGEGYVEFFQWLNRVTGGGEENETVRGTININPAIVEHFVESYLSGPYQVVGGIGKVIKKKANGEPVATRDIPVWNRLFLDTKDNSRDAYYSGLYYYFKDIDKEAKRLNAGMGDHDTKQAQEFRESKEYQYMLVFKDYEKMERKYNKTVNAAMEDGDMATVDEYRKYLADIRDEIAKRCMNIYNGVETYWDQLEPDDEE